MFYWSIYLITGKYFIKPTIINIKQRRMQETLRSHSIIKAIYKNDKVVQFEPKSKVTNSY